MQLVEPEGVQLEYKRDVEGKSIGKIITAFANTYGGTIKIGVDDDGSVVGTSKMPDDITNLIRNNCYPPVQVTIQQEVCDEKTILIITVPVGEHTPYQSHGHYYVRDAATSRDAIIVELIDLFTKGSYKGLITLKTVLPLLEAKIYAGIVHDPNEALLKLAELSSLLDHDIDGNTALEIILMIERLLKIPCNNQQIIMKLLSFLATIAVGKTFSPDLEPPSERTHDYILRVMKNQLILMTPQRHKFTISALNTLLAIGVACIWSNHTKQLKEVITILNSCSGYDKAVTKRCELLKTKLKNYADEEPTHQPRRMGIFFESMFDHKTLKKITNCPN